MGIGWQIMILSVGESRPKKFKIGAKLIMLTEEIDHSHTFVSWADERLGIRKVAEARGGGGRIITNSQFRKENHIVRVFQYNVTDSQIEEMEKWIWEHLMPYSKKHLIGVGLMRLGITRDNPFKDGLYSQICVEMTARALQIALGLHLVGNVEDYGLKEMHSINFENFRLGYCDLASQEMLIKINNPS